jgi:hypothetical protein
MTSGEIGLADVLGGTSTTSQDRDVGHPASACREEKAFAPEVNKGEGALRLDLPKDRANKRLSGC